MQRYQLANQTPFSAKDSGLLRKTRDLLNHHAFNLDPPSGMSQDYNKPLIIPAWGDSFQAITNEESGGVLDIMKHHFTTHFPQAVRDRLSFKG